MNTISLLRQISLIEHYYNSYAVLNIKRHDPKDTKKWFVNNELDVNVDIYDPKSRFFNTDRHPNAPRRSDVDLSIKSAKGSNLICLRYFNAFAVLVNEFANDKIVSIGCDRFAIEQKLIDLFDLDITGFDPHGEGDLVTKEAFDPSYDSSAIRMIIHPYYQSHSQMNGVDYDYESLVGSERAIVVYCPCGASGSTKFIKEMSKDKPFNLDVMGEFAYVVGTGEGFGGVTCKAVFLGGSKFIGTYYDDSIDKTGER
jgi:hypothetical protein